VQAINLNIANTEARILGETHQNHIQILDAIRRSNYDARKPEDFTTVSKLLSDMLSRESQVRNNADLLESLYYPLIRERRERIAEAHKKTFNWVLEDRTSDPTP
jgi:hypothetical protein